MKRLLILFIFLLLCGLAQAADNIQLARMNPYVAGSVVVAGSSCNATPYISYDNPSDEKIFGSTTSIYYGGVTWPVAATKTICKISVRIGTVTGDPSAFEYTAKIWTVVAGGGYLYLDSIITNGTSDHSHISAAGFVDFVWSGNKPTVSSGTTYAITIDHGGADASNYVAFTYGSAARPYDGDIYQWKSDKTWYNLSGSNVFSLRANIHAWE